MAGKKTGFKLNLILLLISLLFVFILGEGAARFIIKAWPFEPEAVVLSFLNEKDVNLRWRYPPWNGLNSLGLKNREIEAKQSNQFRILYLGDSLVWTGETSSGELYTQVIEGSLNSGSEAGSREFEVINAGIVGYTTYQELEFLKVYGLDMNPDLVILGFVFNDLHYKYLSKPEKGKLLGREPEIQLHRFDTHSFPGKLFAKSYLVHRSIYASDILMKKISGSPDFPFESRTDFYLAWKDYGWIETERLIGEMKELLREKNIQFMVVIYPIVNQVDDKYLAIDRDYVLYPQKRIGEICSDNNIHSLDLTETLYRNGGKKLFKDYLHLNEKGNDIVADEVTRHLTDNMLAGNNN